MGTLNVPLNFTNNPAELVEKVFSDIHKNEMVELPFLNPYLSVKAIGFALHEGDWLGVLLTPWTLSALLIAGPDRNWQDFKVGDKFGLKLPSGNYTFFVGAHKEIGTYLSCSLRSPVGDIPNQQAGIKLANDIRRLITAIPTTELYVEDQSRRALFGKLLQTEPTN